METLKYNGEDVELKFDSRANSAIEKELGKYLSEMGKMIDVSIPDPNGGEPQTITVPEYTQEEFSVILKHGLRVEDGFKAMDENPGCYIKVVVAFTNASTAIYKVAEAGNSESPKM